MKTLHTTAKQLTETYKDWSQHQERTMKVDWSTEWTYVDFLKWFRLCLNTKINRTDSRNTWRKMQDEYQNNLSHDVRIIRDYQQYRIRNSGSNLLNTKEMKALYPEINTPPA
jgi:hypothetical protein